MQREEYYVPKYTRKDKKEMIQRCARGIYAEKLRNAGFVSYKGEDLSWYKVVGKDVIHSVYIFSSWDTSVVYSCSDSTKGSVSFDLER